MAKFIIQLPPEVLEDELTRMRPLLLEVGLNSSNIEPTHLSLLQSLTHTNSAVREAASMTAVAAQVVLQDQAHLFTLLDGLSEEKKNFLTYIFNKNEVHNMVLEPGSKQAPPRLHKVQKEMQKLDERLNPR